MTSFLPSSNKTPIADHEKIPPLSGSTVSPTSNSTMVVMLKTNPLIDECPEARPTGHKPILVHGNGGGARFQSFSTTAMATVRKIEYRYILKVVSSQ